MSSGNKNKRRSHPRYAVDDVEGSFSLSSEITITDLSVDGLGVETRSALSVGREYRLKVQRGKYPLELKARVAWCRLVGTERIESGDVLPLYRAGLQFNGLETETASAWQQFVGSKLPIHLERVIAGKLVPADQPDPAVDLDFSAEVISLSGMRIHVGPEVEVNQLLKKTFPIELELGDAALRNKVRILNFAEADEEGKEGFRIGLQWVELGAKNRETLENFIAEYLEGDPETWS